LLRNRAGDAVFEAQKEPLSEPVVARGDADTLAAAVGMERVSHRDKLRRWIENACISG
jgi:hypothetical protein